MRLTFATRRSALALAQSRAFARALEGAVTNLTTEELHIVTSGDKTQDRSLQDIGGKGLFIKELEEALLAGRARFAVHSIKDVPAELLAGLVIACVPERADPRDVLVSRDDKALLELPKGARVGTSSLRRAVAITTARPDLEIVPIRGNVDTRLRKIQEGTVDAVVLARAGLLRLGWEDRASEILSPEVSLPAVGQGALGIECRAEDEEVHEILSVLHHEETAICVTAERAVMAAVEGNCHTPIAAYAVREGEDLVLRAWLADPDGSNMKSGERQIRMPRDARAAERLGRDLGQELKHR